MLYQSTKVSALCLALGLSMLSSTVHANTAATVNGQKISQSTVDFLAEQQITQGAKDSPQLRDAVKEELIRRALLSQEAKKRGLDKSSIVTEQMTIATQSILAASLLKEESEKNVPTDSQLKKQYEEINEKRGKTEYNVRHILVKEESKANEIIKKLKQGKKFANLSNDSIDPGSKSKGGSLGWSVPATFVPPFAEAMANLNKGKYTETPVKTQFGYHVIQVDDIRAVTPPPFDKIKDALLRQAQQVNIEKFIGSLKATAQIN